MKRMIVRKAGGGVLSLILLAWLGNGAAFARTAAPTNTLTFSESVTDKITGNAKDGFDTAQANVFTISARISLAGVPITNFDQDTSFDLTVGELDVSHSLADDPYYVPGNTSATFVDTYSNENGSNHPYQTTKLQWTEDLLTVSIRAKSSDVFNTGQQPILADSYDGNDSGRIEDITSGSIDFGDASFSFDSIAVTGSVSTRHVTKSDGSDFTPSKVRIKGTGRGQ